MAVVDLEIPAIMALKVALVVTFLSKLMKTDLEVEVFGSLYDEVKTSALVHL